ncbi:Hypothetical protein D9617_20g028170 [Elsinoe fawcettii]|nr:Hypothetical protein D9617_20g028170 [Elsinoe fawcettii]
MPVLPAELLDMIADHPRSDHYSLARLAQTCRAHRQSLLPRLYRNIVVKEDHRPYTPQTLVDGRIALDRTYMSWTDLIHFTWSLLTNPTAGNYVKVLRIHDVRPEHYAGQSELKYEDFKQPIVKLRRISSKSVFHKLARHVGFVEAANWLDDLKRGDRFGESWMALLILFQSGHLRPIHKRLPTRRLSALDIQSYATELF